MKYYFILTFIINFSLSLFAQDIVINELQTKNIKTLKNPFSRDYNVDWIELKNTTSTPMDISGYFLSDDIEYPTKWAFPLGANIPANGYLLVYAGWKNYDDTYPDFYKGEYNTNFKLSSLGETLILSTPEELEIDRVIFPKMQNDISYCRLNDGVYSLTSLPTPGMANSYESAFTRIDSDIQISVASGVYPNAQSVEISNSGEGQIYYTLDGSVPTSASVKYTSPISITENSVLKAIAIKSDSEYSIIHNRSYIIGATHKLPVILLTTDNSSRNEDNKEIIDGRVEFIFLDNEGKTTLNQYANFKASGRTSRYTPQLNGKIEANEIYGDDDFDYKMYPNKDLNTFHSFLLRNASQDWSLTHIRDAFISRVLGQDNLADFPFEGYRPAVLYVNAKYQGIINVREDDDDDYIRHNFGLKKGEFKRGVFGIDVVDKKSVNFNDHINISFLVQYSKLGEWGFSIWEDLTGTTDFQFHYNNHDFDTIFESIDATSDSTLSPMLVDNLLPYEVRIDETLKNEALQFIAAIIQHIYNKERTLRILDQMEDELESEIPAHAIVNTQLAIEQDFYLRPFANLEAWKNNVKALRNEIETRIDADIFNRIQMEYGLEAPVQVTYESSDITKGFISVHHVKSVKESYTGTYFSAIPIHFTAEALPGYRFVRWEGDVNSTNQSITPIFTKNSSIKAIFEPIDTPISNTIIINEVQGKNDTTIADEFDEYDDWIELYNSGSEAVNLAGYYISDNPDKPLKWQILDTDPVATTINPGEFILLWADKDLEQGVLHLDFKLKATDQVLLTAPDGVTLIHQISFSEIETDFSYGSKTDAHSDYIKFNKPTPGQTNNNLLNIDSVDVVNDEFVIFPNPASDILTILNTSKSSTPIEWQLINELGQFIRAGNEKQTNLQDLQTGCYILDIYSHHVKYRVLKK